MTVTHKLTSKAANRNVLFGTVESDEYENPALFAFRIEGAQYLNTLMRAEWEIEELPQPVVLPMNQYAVIQVTERWHITRTFWRSDDEYWIEDDSDTFDDAELVDIIELDAKGKFTVLFEGVAPELEDVPNVSPQPEPAKPFTGEVY